MDDPGAHIHADHPFLPPDDARDPVRRLRGRLAAPVTLWTADGARRPHGLTVASTVVAEPDTVLGVLDEDSDLFEAIEDSGRFVVTVLGPDHRDLADAFALVAPAPGGPFAAADWHPTDWGPRLAGAATWAGCELRAVRPAGYGRLVEATIAHAEAGDGPDPLLWYRGRYRGLA